MKIISQEELQCLSLKTIGNLKQIGRNLVKDELDKMDIGQTLLIEKEDWTRKSPPPSCINGWYTNHGNKKLFSSRTLKDESGWVIRRIR